MFRARSTTGSTPSRWAKLPPTTCSPDRPPPAPSPRFWSEQHHVKIQSLGQPLLGSRLHVAEGSAASHKLLALFTDPHPDGSERLIGAVGSDNTRRLLDYAALIGQNSMMEPSGPPASA